MFFKRIFIGFFVILSLLFLFIFCYRLAFAKRNSNGDVGFIGLNDFFSFLETQDLNKPIQRFTSDISALKSAWSSEYKSTSSSVTLHNGGAFSQIWSDLPIAKKYDNEGIIKTLTRIGETISFPCKFVYDIVYMITSYVGSFINFTTWLVQFDGYYT